MRVTLILLGLALAMPAQAETLTCKARGLTEIIINVGARTWKWAGQGGDLFPSEHRDHFQFEASVDGGEQPIVFGLAVESTRSRRRATMVQVLKTPDQGGLTNVLGRCERKR